MEAAHGNQTAAVRWLQRTMHNACIPTALRRPKKQNTRTDTGPQQKADTIDLTQDDYDEDENHQGALFSIPRRNQALLIVSWDVKTHSQSVTARSFDNALSKEQYLMLETHHLANVVSRRQKGRSTLC